VFCSASKKAIDPAATGVPTSSDICRSYRLVGNDGWLPFPATISSPHPFRGKRRQASAFVVSGVVENPQIIDRPCLEWWSDSQWRTDRVPTRGEYLVRPGGTQPMRHVRAVLKLRPPYLAIVSADAHDASE
jgi:hypothetical protein